MARPAVFAALDFEAALARSRADQSVLIVDAMAAWCGPCRQMDRTTWVDAAVVARLTGGASFAIQIDVDAEQAIAEQLEVTAMPTLIAFVNGVEHDRVVGGRAAGDLLAWLDLVERGERFEDAQRAARVAILERRTRAATSLEAKQYDEALVDYRWLWTEGLGAGLADEITELALAHPPARAAFTELRDAAAPTSIDDAVEWITLNEIIGDPDATVRWYDANAAELPPSRATAELVEVAVLPLLIARGRWLEVGRALADPAATFLRLVKSRTPDLRGDACNLVRALYAAGRDERANDLEFEARSADPSPEMAAALATAQAAGRGDRAKR